MVNTDVNRHERARSLSPEGRAFIDGSCVGAVSGATFDCVCPIDGRVIATVAFSDAADAATVAG